LLGHQDLGPEALATAFPWLDELAPRALEQVRSEARYGGYLPRQQAEIRSFQREEAVDLSDVVFAAVGGLSAELRSKLEGQQPQSLGAAARIQGMTPAALAAIAAHVRKRRSVAA
jgi:tRNA uridine 5-carboxymethylaminomethyl modification enzyme